MDVSSYIKIYPCADDPDRVLIYSTLRGAVMQVSRELVDAVLDGTLDGPEQETMARLGFLVPDALAEQRQVAGYFDWANANVRRFTALVTLNLDCNLACPYCYEGHFRGKSYMSESTADLLVETILNGPIAAGREVLLDFYGGEALLVASQLYPYYFGCEAKLTADEATQLSQLSKENREIINAAGFDRNELNQLLKANPERLDKRIARVKPILTAHPPVWPVLLAAFGFLYLWWLAALIFDLAFVWQRYVRRSVANQRLREWGPHGLRQSSDDPNQPEVCRNPETNT